MSEGYCSRLHVATSWHLLEFIRGRYGFGDDLDDLTIILSADAQTEAETCSARVVSNVAGIFAVHVGIASYANVDAFIPDKNRPLSTLDDRTLRNTVLLERAPSNVPPHLRRTAKTAYTSSTPESAPRSPRSQVAQGTHCRHAACTRCTPCAPMPSLIAEVEVVVGDMVEKGQAAVVLESRETETVLRAGAAGVIKAVGCTKGEMVGEGS